MPAYSALILADRPLAYFPFGESAGTVAHNLVGTAATYENGITIGQPSPLTGDTLGRSITADGTKQVSLGTVANISGTNFTLEVWLKKATQTGLYTIVSNAPDSGSPGFWWDIGSGSNVHTMAFYDPASAAWRASLTDVDNDKWHHLALTVSSQTGEYTFYTDGQPDGSGGYGSSISGEGNGAYMFTAPSGNYRLAGSAAHLATYRHALSPERVKAHYLAGRGFTRPTTRRRLRAGR